MVELKPKLGKRRRVARGDWQLYVLIAVPLAFLFIFSYLPMYGLLISFQKYSPVKGVLGSKWVGLANFTRFFTTPSAINVVKNTVLISVYSLIASIPFPIILAILLNECDNIRYRKFVQMVSYAPYFISTVVMVSIMIQMLDVRTGVISNIIRLFGVEPVDMMARRETFRSVYVWSGIWQSTGFNAIIYISALTSIDISLYEAAKIDGANRLQKIYYIDLPSILPTVTILFVLSCGQIMNVGFEKVYLMQNTANIAVSEVLSTYTYKMGLINLDYGYSSAVGLFNSLVNTSFIVLVNAIVRRAGQNSLW